MRQLVTLAFIAVIFIGCSSTKQVLTVRPNEHIELGWTPRSVLQTPAYAWFDSGYAIYQPKEEYIERLRGMKDNLEFLIVYGTWCSDSHREMPRFFKIMDAIGFSSNLITMIATDRSKQLPEGIPQQYGVTHVPTFIVKYRGIEIGRIVELPRYSLEQDIADLLSAVHQ